MEMAHRKDGNNTNSIFQQLVPCSKELTTQAFDVPKHSRRDNYLFIIYLFTYLLAYLITCSMEQSPSSEANRFSTSQEIPALYVTRNFHYQIYKCPPPVPILS
jgi:hypothetical protein